MAGVGLFAKYVFSGLTRKRRAFERSVLMYVSIKNATLTPSGQKRRGCVNQSDGLTHPAAANLLHSFAFSTSPAAPAPGCIFASFCPLYRGRQNQADRHRVRPSFRHQKQVVASPSLNSLERSESDGWCWTICKIRIFRPDKKTSRF